MRARAWLFLAALTATAYAQPDGRDHRRPPPLPIHDHRADAAEPTEAPPPPKEEAAQPRAGFVWIKGRWDWKGKWEWMPGHWERERAGKKWQEARWENQGGHWKLVEGSWVDGAAGGVTVGVGVGANVQVGTPPPVAVPPPAGDAPTEAPPAPKDEPQQPRAGFVWVPGQWDWKAGKYDWTPGHWEREQAGKHWRPARWEQHGALWTQVAGGWEAEGAMAAGVTPPPGTVPEIRDHRHDWKLERPTVSSYWPPKGKAGTRIVIHGVNFPPDAKVMFGGKAVLAAKVKPDMIEFQVPADATASGDIELDRGHGHPVAVGSFEVAAGFDAAAEAKKLDDERRKRAEAEWAEEQKRFAKDKAAREAEWQKREQEMEATREQRREQRAAEIRAKWDAAFLADADTQDELTLHAQRLAELARMKDIAEVKADAKLGVRIDLATQKETDRHDQRMKALHDSFKPGGAK
jgi:hypothetical protein